MEYELIKSRRKTLSIEIKSDGSVLVKAPQFMSSTAIDRYIQEKMSWILKAQSNMKARNERLCVTHKLTAEELKELKKKAKQIIMPLVEEYAEIMGVIYNRVSIRAQKTRWGSCSRDGNLNFNCLLALCPQGAQRYVVVHELCHRRNMNHSKAFWTEVEEYMPDYKEWRRWLKTEGSGLIRML